MIFEYKELLPLVLLPVVAYILYVYEMRKRNSRIVRFTGTSMLEALSPKPKLNRVATTMALLGVTLLALAQSRPGIVMDADTSNNSIVLVIDISGSMTSTDVGQARLDAAKNAAVRFIENAPEQWTLSVVAYNEIVSVPSYPTRDRELSLNAIQGLIAGGGTATGDALALAYAVGRAGDASRVQESVSEGVNFLNPKPTTVILISDGAQTAGTTTMNRASELALSMGIRVSAVALGTLEGEISILTPDGETQILKVPPDILSLQRLAQNSGGQFVSAYNEDELNILYSSVSSSVIQAPKTLELTTPAVVIGVITLLLAYGVYLGRRSS